LSQTISISEATIMGFSPAEPGKPLGGQTSKGVGRPHRKPTTPPFRRLRVFAFDPLLSTELKTATINQIVLPVAWEEEIEEGPVGEYLEVVDCDPAAGCFYAPIDLNDPRLLATDGLAPSEGNPGFHQQMVYAVAMTTIAHFEKALGRKALWAPRRVRVDGRRHRRFVRRLRIYPHALREANAYFSPQKHALLFGYFPASSTAPGRNLPGGTIFTCLSHDVIAHETTHALLHGLHPGFLEDSNPDILAFHEAFADIVALFQHFTFPEVVRAQIAQTRGDLSVENQLGQLAQQVGEAMGSRGALRSAIGNKNPETDTWQPIKPDPSAYHKTFEPHARGALLVAAVFDGFLTIYRYRVADLLRIATGGTGILPAGEIHPDLVSRLAREAAKTAGHVLTMCIRALDYCPPVDLTFGEYLRALITADAELVHDDDLGYRLAMVEAFRRRGLYPLSVRSLAPDSLVWQSLENQPEHTGLLEQFEITARSGSLRKKLNDWYLSASRSKNFRDEAKMRVAIRKWFETIRSEIQQTEGQQRKNLLGSLEALTGLALGDRALPSMKRDPSNRPAYCVRSVRPSRRVGPDGRLVQILIVELTQTRPGFRDPVRQELSERQPLAKGVFPDFLFRGGCTLIFDLETAVPRFAIVKDILAPGRLERQRDFLTRPESAGLRATYFGVAGRREPFALLHRDF
jgi:hypothetical protein